ncbi:MAG: protein TolR [Thiothrix sp.]|nr:MAG: protein TolR [Thiothrix sp.]
MNRLRRVRRKPMSQINVVPYIDVMLVLLVIFMVTAPMMQQGVDIDLPEVAGEPVEVDPEQKEEDKIIVAVDAQGGFYLDQDGPDAQPMDEIALANRVQALLVERENKQVYVRGNQAVNYGRVVEALAALQAAGASGISLMTAPPEKSP